LLVLVLGRLLSMRKVVEPEVIDLVDETVIAGVVDKSSSKQRVPVVTGKH